MEANTEIWCDKDEHKLYEFYMEFNEWLESENENANLLREIYKLDSLSQPSKVFYVGAKEEYEQELEKYRTDRRNNALSQQYFIDQFTDDHWYRQNSSHFDQLMDRMIIDEVVPFIGAGISAKGGLPTWKEHLRNQGRTAGISLEHIDELLAQGFYEEVIEEIEDTRGRDVFMNVIRDDFSHPEGVPDISLLLSELFSDTIITTNYDPIIEKGVNGKYQVINGDESRIKIDTSKVSIIKLHGDISDHTSCIISKNQYNEAYGELNNIIMNLPIPKALKYYYMNSSLLFIGCSLNNDRTVQVFRAIKENIGQAIIPQHFSIEQTPVEEEKIVERNSYLASLGITPIWFEKNQFDYIDEILKFARNELRYRGATINTSEKNKTVNPHVSKKLSSIFNWFIKRIFNSG
jgi:NAD-dependent SIR2 family protein deacetylase